MNLKTKLAATVLMFGSATMAQAAPSGYDIMAEFAEPQAMNNTLFTGMFDWDADTMTISNLMGDMNSSMMVPTNTPNLTLMSNFTTSMAGNIVTATIFKENSSDVFNGGGFATGDALLYGLMDGNTPNENAYFSFSFDTTMGPMAAAVSDIVYGDCSPMGIMNEMMCMTGHAAGGTMNGTPLALDIAAKVSAVPVPAAAWLFGGALISLFGANRRKSVLPA